MDKNIQTAQTLLKLANITVNGHKPYDIRIHNNKTFERVFRDGSLGLGESYMDGWWDCDRLDEFFYRILYARLDERINMNWSILKQVLMAKILNRQVGSKAFEIGKKHYDIGNDLYILMLGKTMVYSCGYWKTASNLDQAQEDKFDLICRKLGLKKGMKILDIGCGWGTLLKYAAQKYGIQGLGITISRQQAKFARNLCNGLPIKIALQDYRSIKDKFDRVISVGMFEHVGSKNYYKYLEVVDYCLRDDGLFLLHTIADHKSTGVNDPWIDKYIFPNSSLPSISQIAPAMEKFFVMEDWHNFGADYDTTLMSWYKNFEKGWLQISNNYNERFHRMWRYYLLSCAGAFRARRIQLWQIVFSKTGVERGYQSVR
ncbi:cyclopropane fatty acyl phospholipid synthase [Candidatus Daviesbacteria bacterium]|nr:cyclopropane fatty acyl phospholipid synthase [Candidatus Daviesbacteria bacterium]